MFTTATSSVGPPMAAAKLILGAVAKAGYYTLMKYYNNIQTISVLACALDLQFNLKYYYLMGHDQYIVSTYIPLYVTPFPFIVNELFIDICIFIGLRRYITTTSYAI